MSAKSDLLTRLEYLADAINEPLLIDVGVLPSKHNAIANLLRKGLGIVAFNIIEDFIKSRAEEGLAFISGAGVPFANLTDSLKESSTIGALRSLQFNASLLGKDPSFDVINLIQNETYNIHSTSLHPYNLSKYSLLYSGSNVTSKEISDFFKSFGINNCWPTLKSISDSIGGGIPDLASAFNNASSRRHSAAHNASFNYSHSWLNGIKSEIIAIAAAMDIAISAKCRQITYSPGSKIDAIAINGELNYRFIEVVSSTLYKEKKSIVGRSIKNWNDLTLAKSSITPRLVSKKEFLIVLNSSSRIIDWHV